MTPLERAARAIADELVRQEPEKGGTYFVDASNLREANIDGTFDLNAIARAVIAAIREPSEPMERAGWTADLPFTPSIKVGTVWHAMIGAMLGERP